MKPEPILSPEVAQLGKAIRFAFVSFILVLSYFTVRAASSLPTFDQIFKDMLGGKALPALTTFIIQVHHGLFALSLLIPIIAIGLLFAQRLIWSFYALGGLCLLTFLLFLTMYHGLTEPFFFIIRQMQGG